MDLITPDIWNDIPPPLQIKHLGLCSELLDVLLCVFLASSMSRPLKICTTLEHALLMVLTKESFL